jgi:long-chain fatty acid transport protein
MGFYTNKLNAVGNRLRCLRAVRPEDRLRKRFPGPWLWQQERSVVVTFQPTVSYAFNDKVSIGFGPTINRIDGTLESQPNLAGLGCRRQQSQSQGRRYGPGLNAGVLVQATDTTRAGLTYHSKVNYKLEGHTEVTKAATVPSFVLANNRYDASLKSTRLNPGTCRLPKS